MADASAFQELQNSNKLSSHLEEEERMDENPNMVEQKDIEIDSDEDDIMGNRAPLEWIRNQIASNTNPRDILNKLVPELTIPEHVDDISLWRLALEILSEPAPRQRLEDVCSIEHVKHLLQTCKKIVVLTGAGVSVSCGIPDFRSKDGIYARLKQDYPDLPNPQSMFDIQYFKRNQGPFFKFAKEIYPGQFTPSLCHRFISFLDQTGRLLKNYSQNIDTLEQVAGIKNVVQCHGSFASATCMNCKFKVSCEDVKEDIFQQKIPHCKKCNEVDGKNIIKPDIVFFGESLPESFHRQIQLDKDKADLLIVIGSSLKVRPVSLIPNLLRPDVPQILINREPLSHMNFDVELYGNCDDVIAELCLQLGSEWTSVLEGFTPNTLDRERWKMFYDYCDNSSSDSGNEEDQTQKSLSESELNSNSDKDSNCNSKNEEPADECQCGVTDSVDDGIEVGQKRKETCSCITLQDGDSGPSPNKRNKSNIHTDQEVYYLSLPPNRYLFHGAELNLGSGSSSDDESSDESDSGGDMFDNNSVEENCEQIDGTSKIESEIKPTVGDESTTSQPATQLDAIGHGSQTRESNHPPKSHSVKQPAAEQSDSANVQANQSVAEESKKPLEELITQKNESTTESSPSDKQPVVKSTPESSAIRNADEPIVNLPVADSAIKSSAMHNNIGLGSPQENLSESPGNPGSQKNLEKSCKCSNEITPSVSHKDGETKDSFKNENGRSHQINESEIRKATDLLSPTDAANEVVANHV